MISAAQISVPMQYAQAVHYRAPGRERPRRRSLAFFNLRYVSVVLVAVPLVALALLVVRTPRTVTLACSPAEGPSLRCESAVEFLWGTSVPVHTTVEAWGKATSSDVRVDLEETGGFEFQEREYFSAQFDPGPHVALTERFASRDRDDARRAARQLETSLREGRANRAEIDTGWTNVGLAVLFAALGGLFLWFGSGRTRVIVDRSMDRVTIRDFSPWRMTAEERELRYGDIVDVTVARTTSPGSKTVYRPALVLQSAEEVPLGDDGLTTPERAEHWARQLRRLIDIERG